MVTLLFGLAFMTTDWEIGSVVVCCLMVSWLMAIDGHWSMKCAGLRLLLWG